MLEKMVEVFKTNVRNKTHAAMMVLQLRKVFPEYAFNFDLHDCDKVLRICGTTSFTKHLALVQLFRDFGFHAEVLEDIPSNDPPPDADNLWLTQSIRSAQPES